MDQGHSPSTSSSHLLVKRASHANRHHTAKQLGRVEYDNQQEFAGSPSLASSSLRLAGTSTSTSTNTYKYTNTSSSIMDALRRRRAGHRTPACVLRVRHASRGRRVRIAQAQ
ncbi:hypothetical protein D9619_012463 [Psilocybe cf. subviscida]|uniref:Uncharacterized protein n=1 Tax=Psilocybe cf. subviscida TaxID=2480587 RepID=A0A8H5ERF4_9AGAR|nr:hypothetical protein D9619_012463 [Psilocybe cf. subviscida]